jgi:hypothetical protein
VRIVGGHPGEIFQNQVLFSLFSLVSPLNHSFLSGSVPGELWLTPPFISPCFSAGAMENIVNFYFCAAPERLRVVAVDELVFKTCFADSNVARLVAAKGARFMMHVKVAFHFSLAAARAAAAQLETKE